MKKLFYSLAVMSVTLACGQVSKGGADKIKQSSADSILTTPVNKTERSGNHSDLFTRSDAEKILGEQAHLKDSSSTVNGKASLYSGAYFADAAEPETGKRGCIYFTFEKYDQISAAKKKYAFIKTANEHSGIKTLDNMGDEAYFHTDGQNFYFIMVRKEKNVFNMKVNKITSKTSLDEFNRISKKITDQL